MMLVRRHQRFHLRQLGLRRYVQKLRGEKCSYEMHTHHCMLAAHHKHMRARMHVHTHTHTHARARARTHTARTCCEAHLMFITFPSVQTAIWAREHDGNKAMLWNYNA